MVVNDYFPELESLGTDRLMNKTGIFNVRLVHNRRVASNYQWVYNYFDGEKVKYIHTYDLRLLRKKVLDLGFDWIILDNETAMDSYKFNNELIDKRNEYIHNCDYTVKSQGSSGVYFVTWCNGHWKYEDNGLVFSSGSLNRLKSIVLDNGGYWIIKDKKLYLENLDEE